MSWAIADAVDYKGFPADKSKTGGWIPAALILGTLSCFLVFCILYALPFLLLGMKIYAKALHAKAFFESKEGYFKAL